VRRLSFQLSGAQLGITVTSLLLGVVAEPAVAHLLRPMFGPLPAGLAEGLSVGLALTLATVAQMVLGELVPKNAALSRPLAVARVSVPPQRVFSALFQPLITAFNAAANAIVRAVGGQPQEELASARSPEELGLLVRLSAEAGTLPTGTAAMLHRALRFGDKAAAEAMTPRVDCVTIEAAAPVSDLLEVARRTGHLRFPVRGDGPDEIVGVVGVAAAFGVPAAARADTPVARIARPPVLVPETLGLSTVLERLHAARAEMAIAVDEYGGFAGMVTSEDLAEELVGDMADEYDPVGEESAEPAPGQLPPGSSVTLPAALTADEVEERTGFRMPEGRYETLAGLVLARLGRLPEPGDGIAVHGWTLTVDAVNRRRIDRITLVAPETADRDGR
jgi:CBS domain containing-hemolysin-like protein